jgi:hypothetical protein
VGASMTLCDGETIDERMSESEYVMPSKKEEVQLRERREPGGWHEILGSHLPRVKPRESQVAGTRTPSAHQLISSPS